MNNTVGFIVRFCKNSNRDKGVVFMVDFKDMKIYVYFGYSVRERFLMRGLIVELMKCWIEV